MTDKEKALNLIKNAKSIVALTGAGISTSAGIPDFRGKEGVYTTGAYDLKKTFDIYYFLKNPSFFYRFARDFLKKIENIKPTFTHYYLAHLEKDGKLKGVITQNIDGLHHIAGNKNIIEVHGSILKSFCLECFKEYSLDEMKTKILKEEIPKCDFCSGLIKPDIVFFNETVKGMDEAITMVKLADLLLIIGTSLVVYPVALLPEYAKGEIVVINKGKVSLSKKRALIIDSEIDEFFEGITL